MYGYPGTTIRSMALWRLVTFWVITVSTLQRMSDANSISLYMQDVANLWGNLLSTISTNITETTQGVFLLQIGANDGSSEGNDHLVQTLLRDNTTHALLVEANPQVFPLLQGNIPKLYHQPDRIRLANALISTSADGAANATFYVVDHKQLSRDLGGRSLPHWVKYELGSMIYEHIHRGVGGFLRRFRKFQAADYIVSMEIPFHSWSQILQEHGISPSLVDVLAIDTEGMDGKLLLAAFSDLAGTGWQPGIVIFEQKTLERAELLEVVDVLRQNGYTVPPDCIPNCPADLVAVHRTGPSFARILAEFPELEHIGRE